jgi:cytochrome oxidase assembly protein ShyY1
MNAPSRTPAGPALSPFLPVLLLSLALIFMLGWQLLNTSRQRSSLKQIQESRAATVQQAKGIQAELQRLCDELLTLAETDNATRELVQRYGISRSAAPAPVGK